MYFIFLRLIRPECKFYRSKLQKYRDFLASFGQYFRPAHKIFVQSIREKVPPPPMNVRTSTMDVRTPTMDVRTSPMAELFLTSLAKTPHTRA
jgi:hypothetical protein